MTVLCYSVEYCEQIFFFIYECEIQGQKLAHSYMKKHPAVGYMSYHPIRVSLVWTDWVNILLRSSQPRFEMHGQEGRTFFRVRV